MADRERRAGRCDLLVRGGRLVDGSGGPSSSGDVAVDGERIAAVGDPAGWRVEEIVDAAGLAVASGFIDVHTHDDLAVLDDPGQEAKISLGVTTVIGGNCGVSLAPLVPAGDLHPLFGLLGGAGAFRFPTLASYRDAVEKAKPATNVALFVGHTTLRAEAMRGDFERPASAAEREAMAAGLRQALNEGALGLSTGLDYPSARPAPTDEIIGLARELKAFANAVYVSHIRNEAERVLDAVDETLEIGLADRGRLTPGYVADPVLFDPATVCDRATFEAPRQRAHGIAGVFVGGRPVWDGDGPTGNRPGRFLARR